MVFTDLKFALKSPIARTLEIDQVMAFHLTGTRLVKILFKI